MVRVRARKVKPTKVRPQNQSKKYKNAFLMKPGPAQKQKIRGPRVRGVKVRPKRRM